MSTTQTKKLALEEFEQTMLKTFFPNLKPEPNTTEATSKNAAVAMDKTEVTTTSGTSAPQEDSSTKMSLS